MAFAFSDERWLPKSILCLRNYNLNKFAHDVIAGITVGLVALPLAMAFSTASGLAPQAGIYCAIVTGLLISALGGSKTTDRGRRGLLWLLWPALSLHMAWTACSCVR
jgi:sulfate permease, SulP family